VRALWMTMGLWASCAQAILQVDVLAEWVPESCRSEMQATMRLYPDGTELPSTAIMGPDGIPLAIHLIFDYDDSLPGGVVESILLRAGNQSQTWTPPLFSLVYPQGPAFPFDAIFAPYPECFAALGSAASEAATLRVEISPGLALLRFAVPGPGMVEFKVVDLLGRTVGTLPARAFAAGLHEQTLSTKSLASGTYFIVLEMGESRQVQHLQVWH
jgi:hypothetical protein